ncbi:MAG TPA: class I SAM-dependent methyltransferase [Ilumatobacteraceae bacterium]|nr:class I SAM-dependent methyltransferase [Ilumatobacteraceae bacterium]
MSLNPPTQYATDANLRARQRLWEHQQPPFDLVSWVFELAGLSQGSAHRVLDVGCGNGLYLARLRSWSIAATGCDLSQGMLASARATERNLVNADVTRLPFSASAFDVVLAPHMLYHVADRAAAALEMRRVTRAGGRCVVVTNGADHMRSLRSLVESAVRMATPGWEMRNPSNHEFSLDNGEDQLRSAFTEVACVRATATAPVVLTDASVAADYVASVEDHYQPETTRPWSEVVDDVRGSVQRQIDANGSFVVRGHSGAFICS